MLLLLLGYRIPHLLSVVSILLEVAYRKMLVICEDDNNWRPKNLNDLFDDVRKIHYKNYFRYLWFDIARISCLQANVLVAYVILAPSIVGGLITLGVMQQIIRAFNKVENSMMYILSLIHI